MSAERTLAAAELPVYPEETPTVVQALSAVMGEVQSVGKTGRNTQQNYSFRGVDAVVNAVGPALRKHGVVVVPIAASVESEHYTTKSGTAMKAVTATVTFRFYGPRGDHIDAQVCGESSDAGDKAVPKAHSVAYRTMLLQALCIPTDEPDPDTESHERVADPLGLQSSRADAPNTIYGEATTPGDVELSFGKHKGVAIRDVPSGYLEWWLTHKPPTSEDSQRQWRAAELFLAAINEEAADLAILDEEIPF